MKRVAVLGMPNTGKSTLFNRLTGAGAHVGNWPGVTVDLLSSRILLGDSMVELVDLPGCYNLHGFSEDEAVVRHFLETQPINLLLVVLNASQLDRQLALPLQLRELGIPMCVLLNMSDEADKHGIRIDLATGSANGCRAWPIVVDADTGFGNALNVRHTIRTLERAGASAVQIEDQLSPKRCGHFSGKDVVPLDEMLGKIAEEGDSFQSGRAKWAVEHVKGRRIETVRLTAENPWPDQSERGGSPHAMAEDRPRHVP